MLPSKNSLSYLQPYDLEEGEIVEDEEEEEIFSDTLSQTDVCFTPENNTHTGSLHQNSNKNLSIDIVSKESKYANNCTPRGYEFLLKQNLPTCKKSSVQKLSSKAQRWALPVRKDGVSNPLHASEMRDRSRSEDSYSCSSSSSCSCSSCSCSSSSYEDAKATSESKDLHHVPKKCLRIPNRHQVKDKDIHTNNNLKYGNFDKSRSRPTAIRYKQFTNEDGYISKPERTRGIIDSRFHHRRRQRNENWQHSFGKPRPAKPHLIVSKDNFKPSDTSTNKVYNKSFKEKKRSDIHDKTLKENKDTTALERFASNIANEPVKKKIVPGSIGEMLLKFKLRANSKPNESKNLPSSNELETSKISENEGEQGRNEKVIVDSLNNLKGTVTAQSLADVNDDEDELTLRYKALQSAMKGCATSPTIEAQLLKLCNFLSNQDSKSCKIAEKSSFGTEGDMKESSKSLGLNEFLTKHASEIEAVDMEISNDSFTDIHEEKDQQQKNLVKVDECSNGTAASHQVIYKSSHLDSQLPIPIEWAYMIPPPPKPNQPNNNFTSIDSWCYNQNMYIQSMQDTVRKKEDHLWYPMNHASLSSENSQAHSQSFLNPMPAEDSSVSSPKELCKADSANMSDILAPGDSSELRDLHAEQYKSFMSTVISENRKKGKAHKGDYRDLVKINLRPWGKSNSQTAHPNLPKGKLGKQNRKRRRNSKKGINVSANISKKKELANPIGENIFDDDDDEDLLRAQLLNEMTLKSQTNRLKNENMPTSLKDQSSNSLKTTANQKSNLKRLQPLPEPQRKEWVKEKRLVKANLSKKLDKPSVRLDIGGRYLDTKNKFPDAPPVTGFSLSSFPPVKPIIIPLGKDSDDSDTEPEPVSISAPKNANLISEINSFIRSFRYSQDKARASEGKPISKAQSSSTSEVKTPKMLNHLSRERQEEYKHLKALFNAKRETLQQRKKIQKKNAVSPQHKKMAAALSLESSKPKPKIPKLQQQEKERGTSDFVKTGEEQPIGHSLPEVKCSGAENHNQRKEYSFDSSVPACSRLELPPPEKSASICTTTEKTSGILRNVHKVCELELNEESIGIHDSGICIAQQKVGNDCSLIRKLNSCEEYEKNANIKLHGGEEDQLNIQLQRENGEIILSLCSENDEKAYTEDGIADSSQDSVQIINESLNDGKQQSSSQDSKITRENSSLDRLNIDSAKYKNKNKTLIASKEHDNESDLQLALVVVVEKNILTLPSKPIVLNEDYVAITEQPHESEEKISDSKVDNFSDSSDENSSSSSDSSSASSFSSDDSDSESEKDQEEINFRNRLLQKRNALLQNSEEVTDKTANEVLPVSDSGEHLGLLGHLAGNSTKDELRQDNSQDNKTTSSDELTKMRQSLTKALDINSLIRHGREMFSKNTKQDSENHVDDFKLKLDHCLQTTASHIDKNVERVVTSSSLPLQSQSKMSSEKKEQFMRKVCNSNSCKKNNEEATVSDGLVGLQRVAGTKLTGENEHSLNNVTLQNSNIPTIYEENADGVKEDNSKENIDDIGKFKKMGATENTSISNIVKKDVPMEDYACIQYKNTSQNTFSEQVNTVEIAKAVKSKHPTGESQGLLNHKSIYMPTKTSVNSSMSHKVVGKVLPTTRQNEAITIQKQRQEELKKAFLAKSMVINRISALLEEASEDEKMCQTLFTKVVKLFSEMETLIKKRKERSSAVNVNVAKAARLVQKLNDDIQLSVKIEKQLTAADRDFPIYAKIRDSNVKDEEQMKKFNVQINALKKSLNFTATQENILMQALSKRFILSAKQEPRPLAQKVTRNFKLDNRVTKGQDRVEGACVQPLRPIIPPKNLVKKGVTDCLSTPPSSYQYFKPHISPKPLHTSQQNTKKNVEDSGILCPYELLGRCNDDHCTFNHPDVTVEVRDAETGNPDPTPALLPVPKVLDKLSETTSAEVTCSLTTSSNLSLGFQITEPTQVVATESALTKVSSHSIESLGLNKHVCEIASQGECTDSKKTQDNTTLIKKPCAQKGENILEDISKELHTEEGNAEKAASIDDISVQELHTKESDCSKRKKSESFKSRKRRSSASKDDNLFAKESDDNSRVANPSVKELIPSIPSECSVLKQNLELKAKRLNRQNISTIQSRSSGKLIKKTSSSNSNKSQENCIVMTLEEDLNEQPLQKGNENAHQLKKNVARRCSMKKDEIRDSRKGSLQRHSSGKCIARKQRGVRSSMNVRRYSPRIKAKQKSKTNAP